MAVTRAKKNLFLLYEFSEKDLSVFVREAAEADCLQINYADLVFVREKPKRRRSFSDYSYGSATQTHQERQGNMVSDEEYDYMIQVLRNKLKEYYGSAMGVMPGMAVAELSRIDSMSDEEVQEEAVRLGFAEWR